jgi:hypothetical protein
MEDPIPAAQTQARQENLELALDGLVEDFEAMLWCERFLGQGL